ncbi:MAG: hypothetical protein CM1200mP2_20330 [Planctomycetaceae bacterium]|nr:MAG: hypothetical protein CM1200mP2_20330 [Planctomycetaceae bacterium]
MIAPGEDTNSDGILTPGFGTTSSSPVASVSEPDRSATGAGAGNRYGGRPEPRDDPPSGRRHRSFPGVARALPASRHHRRWNRFKHFARKLDANRPYIDLITSNTSQFNLVSNGPPVAPPRPSPRPRVSPTRTTPSTGSCERPETSRHVDSAPRAQIRLNRASRWHRPGSRPGLPAGLLAILKDQPLTSC